MTNGPADSAAALNGVLRSGTVRYPRLVPKDAANAKNLQKRTLTNLYNERPTWFDLTQKKLDAAYQLVGGFGGMNLSATSKPPGPWACQTWPKAPAPSLQTST